MARYQDEDFTVISEYGIGDEVEFKIRETKDIKRGVIAAVTFTYNDSFYHVYEEGNNQANLYDNVRDMDIIKKLALSQ